MKVSIVTPIFNEIDNVGPLVDAVVAALAPTPHDFELICVDDGSTDGTRKSWPSS